MLSAIVRAAATFWLAWALVVPAAGRSPAAGLATGDALHTWWDTQRRGANLFNRVESPERLAAARALGVDVVRIAPDKWTPARRDFLIGDADAYEGIPPADLRELLRVLDAAEASGVKVVLTMLSLPGARWRQHNDGHDDGRLWSDVGFHEQAARFWRDLATAIRDHPAIVGYDILNEPRPGKAVAGVEDADSPEYLAWWRSAAGTAADLNAFYRRVHAAIRAVDERTPILLEPGDDASVQALAQLEPIADPAVVYSFHFYEPWSYTTWRVNEGRYAYPDRMPRVWKGEPEAWPRTRVAERLSAAHRWAEAHGVPARRVFVGELGCSRRAPGVVEYLSDVIDAAAGRGWHWAFYSFREDTWSDMDYELGTAFHSDAVLADVRSGDRPREPFHGSPLYQMLKGKVQGR